MGDPSLIKFKQWPLKHQIILLVLLVIVATLSIAGLVISSIVTSAMENAIGNNALELARLIAEMPEIIQAFSLPDPASVIQPIANHILAKTNAKFIVILNMEGIRYSHPRPELVGLHFTGGDEGPALQGQEYISKAVGISGPSIRAFVPIRDSSGRQIGVAVVGMFQENITAIIRKTLNAIIVALLLGLLVGVPGSLLLAHTLKKTMYGMEPQDIAALLRQREAILESIHEGVIAVDRANRITLVNEAARQLLNISPEAIGQDVSTILPSSRLPSVIGTGQPELDERQRFGDIEVLINYVPVIVDNKVMGAVATFRDKTEVKRLAEELTGVQRYVDALRAKTHEFMNKLQTIAGLLELEAYQEARKFILDTTQQQQTLLRFLIDRIRDPATVGLILGKAREAEELGIKFSLHPNSRLNKMPPHFDSDAMVLVIGNFLENSFEALASSNSYPKEVSLSILEEENGLIIRVEDNGPGIPSEILPMVTQKGFSTKSGNRGYGLYLVRQQVETLSQGKLTLASRPGGGCVAEAWIPKS